MKGSLKTRISQLQTQPLPLQLKQVPSQVRQTVRRQKAFLSKKIQPHKLTQFKRRALQKLHDLKQTVKKENCD
jgi:hypothetical protein